MAGANYMGGKRNAAKSRAKDTTGRAQKSFFGRQRLAKGLACNNSLANPRNSLDSTSTVDIYLAHARRASGPTLIHSVPQSTPKSVVTTSAIVDEASSSGAKSSHSRSSRILDALDTSQPIFRRAALDRIVALPNLAGLSRRHLGHHSIVKDTSLSLKRPSDNFDRDTKRQKIHHTDGFSVEGPALKELRIYPSGDPYISPSRQTVYEISLSQTGQDDSISGEFVSMDMDDSSDSGYPDFEYGLERHSLDDPNAVSPLQSPFSTRFFSSKHKLDAGLPISSVYPHSDSSLSSLRPFSSESPIPFSTPGPVRRAEEPQSHSSFRLSNHRVHFYPSPGSAKIDVPVAPYPRPTPLASSMLSYQAPSYTGHPQANLTIESDLVDILAPVQEGHSSAPVYNLFDDEDPWNTIGKLLNLRPTVNLSDSPSLAELLSQEHDKSGVGYISRKSPPSAAIPWVPPTNSDDDDGSLLQDNCANHLSLGSPLYPAEVVSHSSLSGDSSKPEDPPLVVDQWKHDVSPAVSDGHNSCDRKQDLSRPDPDDSSPQPLSVTAVHVSISTQPSSSTIDNTPSFSSPHLSDTHSMTADPLNVDIPDLDLQQSTVEQLQVPKESGDAGKFFESPCLFSEPEDESEGDE